MSTKLHIAGVSIRIVLYLFLLLFFVSSPIDECANHQDDKSQSLKVAWLVPFLPNLT